MGGADRFAEEGHDVGPTPFVEVGRTVTQEAHGENDLNRSWEDRDPVGVDTSPDDRREVVVNLDIPRRDDHSMFIEGGL